MFLDSNRQTLLYVSKECHKFGVSQNEVQRKILSRNISKVKGFYRIVLSL